MPKNNQEANLNGNKEVKLMAQKCSNGNCQCFKGGNCSKSDSELKGLSKNNASLGGNKCPGFKSKIS